MRTINHSSTVINPRGPVVACCFVWNLLVRTMRPSFSGEASLGLAQGNREEGLLSKEARLAVLFEEHVRREACMAQSRLTPSRTPTQPSSLVAEAAIPYQGRDSRRSTRTAIWTGVCVHCRGCSERKGVQVRANTKNTPR